MHATVEKQRFETRPSQFFSVKPAPKFLHLISIAIYANVIGVALSALVETNV
jgi:hypothetical protein